MTDHVAVPEATPAVHVHHAVSRTPATTVQAFRDVSAATAHEAMERGGALHPRLEPLHPAMRVCGPAVTVLCLAGDNLMIHKAMAMAQPGDVLVVAVAGSSEHGFWGDLMTTSAQARGIAGLVIDGCVRDREAIVASGFPVFAAGISIRGTDKRGLGLVNHPIVCGDALVWPGDLLLGDGDGLVCVPRAQAESVLERARERDRREDLERVALGRGELLLARAGYDRALRELGMNER